MIEIDRRTRIVASSSSWIEGEAERQLRATAALPGVRWAVGLPDIHPGKGHPIGAAVLVDGVVYPHLVGGDIGCGMALFQTDARADRASPERLARCLRGLEGPWMGDAGEWLATRGVFDKSFVGSLGTIGGGNHFAELQIVEDVSDAARVRSLEIDDGSLLAGRARTARSSPIDSPRPSASRSGACSTCVITP